MVSASVLRRMSHMLRAVEAMLVACIPVSLVAIALWPPEAPTLDLELPAPTTSQQPAPVVRELAWYAPLWERDLAQPPIPPSAPPPTPPPPEGPKPALIATFVEANRGYAHLIGLDGQPRLLGLNDSIDGFLLAHVEPGRARLTRGDQEVWVEMPKPRGEGP